MHTPEMSLQSISKKVINKRKCHIHLISMKYVPKHIQQKSRRSLYLQKYFNKHRKHKIDPLWFSKIN